ncbi:hypothetical protein HMPREF9946_05127 [Acetobacteraceae bacterium AT-5844]|nr:hypothetical protein HMPREF9946_05127 [Acetobacteraceae bacterium AT-5844]
MCAAPLKLVESEAYQGRAMASPARCKGRRRLCRPYSARDLLTFS